MPGEPQDHPGTRKRHSPAAAASVAPASPARKQPLQHKGGRQPSPAVGPGAPPAAGGCCVPQGLEVASSKKQACGDSRQGPSSLGLLLGTLLLKL